MKQSGFSDLEYDVKKKQTRKEQFLTEMDATLPWQELLNVIKRHYPKGQNGRPPAGTDVFSVACAPTKPLASKACVPGMALY